MPGSSTQAAISAIIATNDSISIAAVADQAACATRVSIIFGVVPEEISEWKPDTAPQAIVMNTNGNSAPANTGPAPSMKRVVAGIASGGATT